MSTRMRGWPAQKCTHVICYPLATCILTIKQVVICILAVEYNVSLQTEHFSHTVNRNWNACLYPLHLTNLFQSVLLLQFLHNAEISIFFTNFCIMFLANPIWKSCCDWSSTITVVYLMSKSWGSIWTIRVSSKIMFIDLSVLVNSTN